MGTALCFSILNAIAIMQLQDVLSLQHASFYFPVDFRRLFDVRTYAGFCLDLVSLYRSWFAT